MEFLILLFAVIGGVYIMCESNVMKWYRDMVRELPFLGSMILCPRCTAFWVGLIIFQHVWYALAGVGIVHVFYTWVDKKEDEIQCLLETTVE